MHHQRRAFHLCCFYFLCLSECRVVVLVGPFTFFGVAEDFLGDPRRGFWGAAGFLANFADEGRDFLAGVFAGTFFDNMLFLAVTAFFGLAAFRFCNLALARGTGLCLFQVINAIDLLL